MAKPKAPRDLLAQTLERLESRPKSAERLDAMAQIGDVYVFERTREYPLEWVFVARDPNGRKQVLVVPADGNFLAGSTDLELPAEATAGALKLRCRFGAWIAEEMLAEGVRVGRVGEEVAARARRKWLEVGQGGVRGRVLEREVDDDPEYREWVEEVLVPAREVLANPVAGRRDSEAVAEVVSLEEYRTRERNLRTTRRWALATAAMLGTAVVGLSFQMDRMGQRLEQPFVLPSLELEELDYGEERPVGVPEVVTRDDLWAFYLFPPKVEGAKPSAFRVDLVSLDSARVVWRSAEQPWARELLVVIPRSKMPPGVYRVELHGIDTEREETLLEARNVRFEVVE